MNGNYDFNQFCAKVGAGLTRIEVVALFERELFETQRQIQLKKMRHRENRHFSNFHALKYVTTLEQALNLLKGYDQEYYISPEDQKVLEKIMHQIAVVENAQVEIG